MYETELSDIDFFKETTEILDVVFKKLTGVYYQVLKLETKPRVFKPDNTRMQLFWTASKSLI